ncbi:putative Outer envelope pore protein 21A, chloroplastic [Nannochloris sp. 'desiccata']|nr:putative Outer envelope pore protein 21A, chloroplastic [Chlorella desiccata (nom. nud.)]
METSLLLDNKTKQLNLFFKKRFEHKSDVALKLHGLVNTVTSRAQVEGSILKFFRLGTEPRFSDDDIYRPDQRLRLGIGAKSSSSSEDVFLTLNAKQKVRLNKQSEMVRGRQVLNSYTEASLRANYNYNIKTEAWGGEAVAKISTALFKFSDDQDVRLSAGCRIPLTPNGAGKAVPFVRVEENCWGVTTDLKGGFVINYAL